MGTMSRFFERFCDRMTTMRSNDDAIPRVILVETMAGHNGQYSSNRWIDTMENVN